MNICGIISTFKGILKKRSSFFIRRIKKPKYHLNKDGKVCIHLGCGEIRSPGFINVDAVPWKYVHHIRNIKDLSIFKNEYADLVYACMVLEHIPRAEIPDVLTEWKRVLKKGGVLRLTVPDFDSLIRVYNDNSKDISIIAPALMGGQDYKHNFHFSVFNKCYLTKVLHDVGFSEVGVWDPKKVENHEFEDWASKLYEVNNKKYNISLNLEAIK